MAERFKLSGDDYPRLRHDVNSYFSGFFVACGDVDH
jgi:hypothetical protein